MHDFLFHCHESVDRNPGVTEECELFNSIPDQNTAVLDIDKHYLCQSLLLIAPAQ